MTKKDKTAKRLDCYLSYGLQPSNGIARELRTASDFELLDVELGSADDFCDHKGVVIQAGVFETLPTGDWDQDTRCISLQDLDKRDLQTASLIRTDRVVIYL